MNFWRTYCKVDLHATKDIFQKGVFFHNLYTNISFQQNLYVSFYIQYIDDVDTLSLNQLQKKKKET